MDDVLRDQRTMVGPTRHRSVTDVADGWQEWADRQGLPIRRRQGDTSTDLRSSDKVVVAYVSGGKWIADCPNCNGGIPCWSGNPRGACLDCGTIYFVDHPSAEERARVEELLRVRVNPNLRSWHRHRGETLDDLAAENEAVAAHDRLSRDRAGNVALADVARILGDEAVEQLRERGVS